MMHQNSEAKKGYLKTHYEKTISVKIFLLVLEVIALVVSFFYLSKAKLDISILTIIGLLLISYFLERSFTDILTKVRFPASYQILPLYLLYEVAGLSLSVIANAFSYLASVALKSRRFRGKAFRAHESALVFLLVLVISEKILRVVPSFHPELAIFKKALALATSFLVYLLVDSYFESHRLATKTSSHFWHSLWLGFPIYLTSAAFALSFERTIAEGFTQPAQFAVFLVLVNVLLSQVYRNVLESRRNKYGLIFELLSALSSKKEKDERKRNMIIDYVRKMSHEAGLKGDSFDKTVIAGMLHDFGKAGIDVYSIDSIIEDIRADKGDPLHAERAYLAISQIDELKDVAEIIRYHHKYQDKETFKRLKKSLRFQASIINVAESFAENMVSSEEPIYDERHAYKDLKKNSGWDFDPKALRMLRNVLIRSGFTRL